MIDRRFFNFKKYDTFLQEKSSIPNDAIVFIQDKLCIWTHGTEYMCNGIKDSVLNQNSLEFNDSTGRTAFSISINNGNVTLVDSTGNSLQEQYVLKSEFDSYKAQDNTSAQSILAQLEQTNNTIATLEQAHNYDISNIQRQLDEEIQYRQNADLNIASRINDIYTKSEVNGLLSDGNWATEGWVSDRLNDVIGIDAEEVQTLVSILSDNDTMTGLLSEIASKADKNQLFSGSYNDLTDKPTDISGFNNDAGYLTEHQDISNKADKQDLEQLSHDVLNSLTILQRLIDEKYVLKKDVYSIIYSDWNEDTPVLIKPGHFVVYEDTLYTTDDIPAPSDNSIVLIRDDFYVSSNDLYV